MEKMPFLDIAEQGENSSWRYAISLPFILGTWVLIGGVFTLWILAPEFSLSSSMAELEMSTPRSFVAFMASFIPWLLGTVIAVRWIHGRPIRTLITAYERPRWQRIAEGFGYWFLLVTLISLLEAWLYPGRYRFSFPADWKDYLLPALILIPLQTSTEEIFFRGYLLQAIGLKMRNQWMLLLLSGIFFALPHIFNPEVSVNFWLVMASYFVTGVFAAWITLRDGGLELALGMHAANNLYALVANYPNSAINIPSLFAIRELDATYGLLAQIVASGIFFWLVFRRCKAQDERI